VIRLHRRMVLVSGRVIRHWSQIRLLHRDCRGMESMRFQADATDRHCVYVLLMSRQHELNRV